MQNTERNVEPLGESLYELRCEADLRDEHECALPASERTLHDLQVHLGLAAAGDAVEYERAEFPKRIRDAFDGLVLFGRQLWRKPPILRSVSARGGRRVRRVDLPLPRDGPSSLRERSGRDTPIFHHGRERCGADLILLREELEQSL